MALAVAVFALLVLALVVSTLLFTAHLEQRAGRSAAEAGRALEAAEAGLAEVLAGWDTLTPLHTLSVGDSTLLPAIRLDRRSSAGAVVRRMADHLYLIRAEGTSRDAAGNVLARRSLVRLARSGGGIVTPLPQWSWMQVY